MAPACAASATQWPAGCPSCAPSTGWPIAVEIARGGAALRILFDFGLTAASMNHDVRELGVDPRGVDALALSHGHRDHFGGLLGFLHAYRRTMRRDLTFYAGQDHFRPAGTSAATTPSTPVAWTARDLERYDVDVAVVGEPCPWPRASG